MKHKKRKPLQMQGQSKVILIVSRENENVKLFE